MEIPYDDNRPRAATHRNYQLSSIQHRHHRYNEEKPCWYIGRQSSGSIDFQPRPQRRRAFTLGHICRNSVQHLNRRQCPQEMCQGEGEATPVPPLRAYCLQPITVCEIVGQRGSDGEGVAGQNHPFPAREPVREPRREESVCAVSVGGIHPGGEEQVLVDGEH